MKGIISYPGAAEGTVVYLIRDAVLSWIRHGELCSGIFTMGTSGVLGRRFVWNTNLGKIRETYTVYFGNHRTVVDSDCLTTDPMDIARLALTL